MKNSVGIICIEAILIGQKPGKNPSNSSVQLLTKSAATGAINIIPDIFITTKPSILLFANALIINAKIGACIGANIRIYSILPLTSYSLS